MDIDNVSTYIIILEKEFYDELDKCRAYFDRCGKHMTEYELLKTFVVLGLRDWRKDMEENGIKA